MNDEEYLRSDPHVRVVASGTPLERARQRLSAATSMRCLLEREIAALRANSNPQMVPGGDAADRLRFAQMAALRLRCTYERYADALLVETAARQDCMRLKPRSQPRREPQPVVWLDKPARSYDPQLERWKAHFREHPPGGYMTRMISR